MRDAVAAALGRAWAPAARPSAARAAAAAAPYVELVRFRYHATFVAVLVGALVGAARRDASLVAPLALLYVAFNVLLYGGVYAMNAVTDAGADRRHPTKRLRPVPSGRVSPGAAASFAAASIAAGLAAGLALFGQRVFWAFVAFVAVNVAYSRWARNVPYVELVGNSVTHPLRFVLGVVLVGGRVPAGFVAGVFFFALGLAAVRRALEKDVPGWEARETLRAYSGAGLRAVTLLPAAGMLALWAFDHSVPRVFYAVMLPVYAVLAFGVDVCGPLRRLFVALYTR